MTDLVPTLLAQDADTGVSLLRIVLAGGLVGYFIIFLSVVALALAVAHAIHIRLGALAPDATVDRLHGLLTSGDLPGAAKLCNDPDEANFLTRVMGAGLKNVPLTVRCARTQRRL